MRFRRSSFRRACVGVVASSAALVAAACSSFGEDSPVGANGTDASVVAEGGVPDGGGGADVVVVVDAAPPPPVRACPKTAAFGTPVEAPADALRESGATLEAVRFGRDGIAYVGIEKNGTHRLAAAEVAPAPKSRPELVAAVNATAGAEQPAPSADALALFFQKGESAARIFVSTRPTVGIAFGDPALVPIVVETTTAVQDPYVANGTLYFTRVLDGAGAGRAIASLPLSGLAAAPNIIDLGPGNGDEHPVVSADGLELFFSSRRAVEGGPESNIWRATRDDVTRDFGTPAAVDLPRGGNEKPTWISPDACELYYLSEGSLYRVRR